jgi:hypothetical protein
MLLVQNKAGDYCIVILVGQCGIRTFANSRAAAKRTIQRLTLL